MKMKWNAVCPTLHSTNSDQRRDNPSEMARGSHSFSCHPHVYPRMEWAILHSLRNHSPDGAARARQCTAGSAYYSFIDLERMKGWVGVVGWPYSEWFTHISGHLSAIGRAWDRESSLVKDWRSTVVQRSQPDCVESAIKLLLLLTGSAAVASPVVFYTYAIKTIISQPGMSAVNSACYLQFMTNDEAFHPSQTFILYVLWLFFVLIIVTVVKEFWWKARSHGGADFSWRTK